MGNCLNDSFVLAFTCSCLNGCDSLSMNGQSQMLRKISSEHMMIQSHQVQK